MVALHSRSISQPFPFLGLWNPFVAFNLLQRSAWNARDGSYLPLRKAPFHAWLFQLIPERLDFLWHGFPALGQAGIWGALGFNISLCNTQQCYEESRASKSKGAVIIASSPFVVLGHSVSGRSQ